jgi:oxygen-dependent protoporphyrinogen oxidase
VEPVLVIGAGIAGLACAHALARRGIDTVVIEAGARVGGVIQSERIGGFLVERGPNSMLPTAHTFQLLEEIGLLGELIEADRRAPRYVVVDRRLRKIPFGALTAGGMARALAEPFIRSKSAEGESVAQFFRRRFGSQAHERLAAPFIGGIYAGDPEKLCVAAAFPRLVELEGQYGSIMTGMLRASKRQRGVRRGVVSSFADGLETLPRRLADGLRVELNATDVRIGRTAPAAATVIATPAYAAAEIVRGYDADLAGLLAAVHYEPVVIAATAARAEAAMPRGFGFLAPQAERMTVLGTLFNSSLFPNRAPTGKALLTSYLGGALKPEAYDWPDTRVWDMVCPELKRVLNLSSAPDPVAVFRRRRAIPQFLAGHLGWRRALEAQLKRSPGLFVTGNYIDGVSVPAAMEHAEKTADAVAAFLENPR